MITTDCLVSCQEPEQPLLGLAHYEIAFLFAQTPGQLNLQWLNTHPDLLNFLVARVAKQPENLVTHIQRICLCYQKNLSAHLYGAMVDFFSALNGHANDFSYRLLKKVQPKLNPSHAYLLAQYLQDNDIASLYMVQSSFTVTGKGVLGTTQLITKLTDNTEVDENLLDPLALARDHIEYSQFQEAQTILEKAILSNPSRNELHLDLLELYKSLQDVNSFLSTYQALAQQGNPFPEMWNDLYDFFIAKKMLHTTASS